MLLVNALYSRNYETPIFCGQIKPVIELFYQVIWANPMDC